MSEVYLSKIGTSGERSRSKEGSQSKVKKSVLNESSFLPTINEPRKESDDEEEEKCADVVGSLPQNEIKRDLDHNSKFAGTKGKHAMMPSPQISSEPRSQLLRHVIQANTVMNDSGEGTPQTPTEEEKAEQPALEPKEGRKLSKGAPQSARSELKKSPSFSLMSMNSGSVVGERSKKPLTIKLEIELLKDLRDRATKCYQSGGSEKMIEKLAHFIDSIHLHEELSLRLEDLVFKLEDLIEEKRQSFRKAAKIDKNLQKTHNDPVTTKLQTKRPANIKTRYERSMETHLTQRRRETDKLVPFGPTQSPLLIKDSNSLTPRHDPSRRNSSRALSGSSPRVFGSGQVDTTFDSTDTLEFGSRQAERSNF